MTALTRHYFLRSAWLAKIVANTEKSLFALPGPELGIKNCLL